MGRIIKKMEGRRKEGKEGRRKEGKEDRKEIWEEGQKEGRKEKKTGMKVGRIGPLGRPILAHGPHV